MIERLTKFTSAECCGIVDFLNKNFNYDFYYTLDNARNYVRDVDSLRVFLKSSENIFIIKNKGDYIGIALIWKSVGGGKNRYYVKLNAKSPKIAKDLLTVLSWNSGRDLFVKVRKDSIFLSAFKYKGYKFKAGRGIQLLLQKRASNKVLKIKYKEENELCQT